MSEFHLHLNDDFEYNKDGLSTKTNTTWSGLHRLESDVYPSLTAKDIYTGEALNISIMIMQIHSIQKKNIVN